MPLAHELSELNEERKRLTETQTLAAIRYFEDLFKRKGSLDPVLGVFLKDAHESVAGIIAGRLKENYHRPVFVVTDAEGGQKGSGRSVEAYNMIQEISKVPEFFERFGGHAMACGFTLKRGLFYSFMETLNQNCTLSEQDLKDVVWIDMHLPLSWLTEELVNELELLKPFGQNNKKPVFADKDIYVNRFQIMGQKKNALKLYLETADGVKMDGILFGSPQDIEEKEQFLISLSEETGGRPKIACLYYPQINEFRDMRTLQIVITDMDRSR